MHETLTVAEVAGFLRVTPRMVTKLASQREIPAYKIGRVWRIDRRGFLRWLKERQPKRWQTYTGAARPGTSDSRRPDGKSGSRLDQLLRLTPSDFSANGKKNTTASQKGNSRPAPSMTR
jgi:excisionase family DNA binding protein